MSSVPLPKNRLNGCTFKLRHASFTRLSGNKEALICVPSC